MAQCSYHSPPLLDKHLMGVGIVSFAVAVGAFLHDLEQLMRTERD